jgi:hypothetical protein
VSELVRLKTKTNGSKLSKFDNTRLGEQLTLRNSGIYLYDPQLLTLSLGGTFGLSQEWITSEEDNAFRNGTLGGYDLFASVLSDAPYSMNLFAYRNTSVQSRELAGRSEVRTENRGVTLFAHQLPIPSTLSFRQEVQDEESKSGSVTARREDHKNIVSYEAQRGWINNDMELQYEFIDETDALVADFSYQSHEGNLNYGVDFGSELNRHFESRLRYFTRSGLTDLTSYAADESLRIEHNERFHTGYRYQMLNTQIPEGATTTHTGTINAQHRLYENLTTTALSDGTIQTLPGGEKDALRGRVDVAYVKRLPWQGQLVSNIGGGLEYEDDRFDVTVSFVPQEPHTAGSSFALPIILRNVFVVTSSVVVTKTAFGSLSAGCIAPAGPPTLLVLGRDYTLRTTGDTTQIVPIPCSGSIPGINPGDSIAADYQYDVARSLTFTTSNWHADLSVDYHWIRPYVSHSQTAQHLISGNDGRFLDDRRSDTAGIEVRFDTPRVRASVLTEAGQFDSGRLSYAQLQSTQFLGVSLLPELTLSISADQALLDYSNEDHKTFTQRESANITYAPSSALLLELYGAIRRLHDTLFPTEQTMESSLRLRWFLRGLEVSPVAAFFKRRRGNTETAEWRTLIRLIRRF